MQILNPEPQSMQDYNTRVDAERNTIIFRGRWKDQDLELHTTQKVFELHRGFHWVQELPHNR